MFDKHSTVQSVLTQTTVSLAQFPKKCLHMKHEMPAAISRGRLRSRETGSKPFLQTEQSEPLHSNRTQIHMLQAWLGVTTAFRNASNHGYPGILPNLAQLKLDHTSVLYCLLVTSLHPSRGHLSTEGSKVCMVRPCCHVTCQNQRYTQSQCMPRGDQGPGPAVPSDSGKTSENLKASITSSRDS